MIRIKGIRRIVINAFSAALAVSFLVALNDEIIRFYIKPHVLSFVQGHVGLLKNLPHLIFIGCGACLIFIVWWLEWDDKKRKSLQMKYKSKKVCEDYYKDIKKINVYNAIRSSLSKFSRASLDGEDIKTDKPAPAEETSLRREGDVLWRYRPPKPKMPMPVMEDIADGPHLTYHANGQLSEEATYKDNKLDGLYRSWYEDGKRHQEKYFKEGKLHGIFKAYDEEGVPYFEISFKNDIQDGVMKTYYKNGVMEYCDTFKNGKIIQRQSYNEAGALVSSWQMSKENKTE